MTVSIISGKMRMSMPCRPTTCDHLQCFDASLFLMMNEKKPTWTCPVCDSPAKYDDLMVDGYFQVLFVPFCAHYRFYSFFFCSLLLLSVYMFLSGS